MATVAEQDLLPEVQSFLARDQFHAVIGGQRVASSRGETFETRDPGSGTLLATVANMQADDVDRAVAAAQAAFVEADWAGLPVNERAVLLHRLADAVEKRLLILAQIESLDAGKILAQAEGDVQNFVDTMRYFADLAQHVQPRIALAIKGVEAATVHHAWGPCGFIVPWNFPLLLVGWGLGPALAAGNTAVIKPAEDTPLSAIYLAELAQEVGIPDGVINVVPGLGEVTGAALANHPGLRRMSFTGSPEVGRLVAEACGRNLTPVKLELGGKGAAVIFNDVDVADTADKLVEAITFHTGQVCCDATRWLVQRDVYDQFVDECVVRLKNVRIGYQRDADAQMGPVVNAKQRERVLGYLKKGQDEGAELVLEGGAAEVSGREGFYVKPALLAGSLDNVAAREEIFGPVAYLAPFDDEEQAVAMANATDYGLANSVWSADLGRARRVAEAMDASNSWINAHNVFSHGIPYGGVKKSGVGGGVNSIETLLDYWWHQSVVRPL
ncbi:MAG: aldehyde dehydrogenase [Planctomycetota bacterium]|nr:MAG: aldehyde dehydrogenase [Planctomycetota bacterium]REJ89595.1 MAG: aldehyde dehydrogenase [Planctomycetota bacterium]REK31488.1 MAG: aldehyde dehydrogenase [Planctomycetota bacterium]REK40718.1 MAG: aldehyde dehydrogenase [Planctomycetota bacterium]